MTQKGFINTFKQRQIQARVQLHKSLAFFKQELKETEKTNNEHWITQFKYKSPNSIHQVIIPQVKQHAFHSVSQEIPNQNTI